MSRHKTGRGDYENGNYKDDDARIMLAGA